jgi:hypothetical protein
MTKYSTLVRMETNVAGGGYTITFIYIRDTFTIELEVFS